ncbi:hypothetical protein Tco_0804750 [Tanacetum coccineum]|uniref:Reverse transcriptase domain-containing protein n=1 Tax=Tanacetum coccineum TaxID=301880 RepID=A0ABQ5A9E9_9ASTR
MDPYCHVRDAAIRDKGDDAATKAVKIAILPGIIFVFARSRSIMLIKKENPKLYLNLYLDSWRPPIKLLREESKQAALSAKREEKNRRHQRSGGAVELCRWFEKIKSVFGISECAERSKVKFAAATLQGRALTWWNSQVATLGLEFRGWENDLREPKVEIIRISLLTLNCFNELALLCPEAVPTEKKKVELYIKGFPKSIKGETTSSRPTVLNEAVRMAHTLMEQKLQAKAERIAEGNKRKWENNNNNNNNNNNINRKKLPGTTTSTTKTNKQRQGNAKWL